MTLSLVFSTGKRLKDRKRYYHVIMTSNSNLLLLYEFSGPKLVSIPNFSSISLKMAELFINFIFLLSKILRGTFCNFVAMVTPQNVTNWYNLKMCLKDVPLMSKAFSFIA